MKHTASQSHFGAISGGRTSAPKIRPAKDFYPTPPEPTKAFMLGLINTLRGPPVTTVSV